MFIIVPKHRGPAAHVEPSEGARGLTRTQNACQGCKVRKVKCDGSKPCSRCRARDIVCVYGKVDASKLALYMTPERCVMLQEQNDRLAQALRRMAARLAVLESRHITAGYENSQDTDNLGESPDGAQHADITEILDRYAPAPAESAGVRESHENSHRGGRTSGPHQSKRRRVDDDGGELDDLSLMIMPTPQLQPEQMINNDLPTGGMQPNAGLLYTNDATNPATSSLDTFDSRSTAYQTLLHMSQAQKTRATQLRGQECMVAGFPDIANTSHAMPASLGPDGQDPSLYLPPRPVANGSTAPNGGFPDSLLDLVDWDLSLENCGSVNWNWSTNGQ